MIVVRSVEEVAKDQNTVLTVGTFDGVHIGHQEIVREVINRARMREGRSVVITFDPHPKEIVASTRGPVHLLTTLDERIEILTRQGVDLLLVLHFTPAFSQQTSEEFYRNTVVREIGVAEVVVGYDHMFGRNREAGTEELLHIGREFDFSVFTVHPYSVDGETVSSTKVRHALAAGEVERAAKMLGYSYPLRGEVVVGDMRGRSLGYPTANLRPMSEKKVIPARGVYLVSVALTSGEHFGMMNIGMRPTVTDGQRQTIEVHLFDFEKDIYGEHVTVTFLRRLREEKKFESLQALIAQLGSDKEQALRLVAEHIDR